MILCRTTTLIFFNKRVNDIIWAEQLDRLQNEGNLKVVNVLSQADSDLEWTGERGRVSKDLLTKYLPKSMDGAKIFVCGPDPFVQKALRYVFISIFLLEFATPFSNDKLKFND